jgi:hypothetical protein
MGDAQTHLRLSLIRHGPLRKFTCNNSSNVACVRCRRNVFTEPLPSNDKGIFAEPLPSNDGIDTHIDTQTDGRDL